LIDKDSKETAIFSGDTLFIGDVGDLISFKKAASMTQDHWLQHYSILWRQNRDLAR
jgi:hypothetical protein